MFSHQRDGYSGRASEYASAQDFCRIFHQDMDVLYWLALALTADAAKAEQWFVAGLDECLEERDVQRVGAFLEPACGHQERNPAGPHPFKRLDTESANQERRRIK